MSDPLPPTHTLVHRRPQEIQAPFAAELAPPRQHGRGVFAVESEVLWPAVTPDGRLKGPPELRLRWQFRKGSSGTIVGFRRKGGFGKDGDWGDCVVSCDGPGEQVERLDPGDYFYTFCTRHSVLGMARVYRNEVQFFESVPSAARVLELMRQAVEYTKLRQEFGRLTEPAPAPEDPQQKWEREFRQALAGVDARLEAAGRLREKCDRMKQQVEEGSFSDKEKRQRLRALEGMRRELRERFEL